MRGLRRTGPTTPAVRRAAAVCVLLLLAACGPEPAAGPLPGPQPPPPPPLAALTGVPLAATDADVVPRRPVVAVKVDNHPAARPQAGLERADVVLVELVEGGLTRFIALYHSADPGRVGPVRSGREADALLLPPFDPLFAISGAAPAVWDLLRLAGLTMSTEGAAGWARVSDRRPPHNLYVDVARLSADAPALRTPAAVWPRRSAPPPGGQAAAGVGLSYSPASTVSWTWTGAEWQRAQDGTAQATADGGRLTAANVVVARTAVEPGPRGQGTVALGVLGAGDAVLLRDGRAYAGRWRRANAGEHYAWTDGAGEPLPLAPGRTWIELLPADAPLTVTPGGP